MHFMGKEYRKTDFPGGLVVKTLPSFAGVWIQSLVGELSSHMPQGPKKKTKIKQN